MNRDLFLAILSMDSYNRGYGQGISNLPNLGAVGNAVIKDIPLPAGSLRAGFYGIAYDWNGETVIAYRGTDKLNPLVQSSDIWTGWIVGAGFSGASQAGLARSFYENVVFKNTPGGSVFSPVENVTLTGHSLGGGLATNDNAQSQRLAA